jgi:non-heme chloroperoxidase
MPALQSRDFTTSDGVRLRVLEAGPRSASPVVVFVPGWSMPAALWRHQLESLSGRHRVAALDPRGQGESAVAHTGYTAERRAADIAELVAAYPRVVLVGWSLGALESLQYVVDHGEARLAGLVLVDSPVGELTHPPSGVFRESLRGNRRRALNEFVHAMFRTPQPQAELDALVQGALRLRLEDSIALLSYPFPSEHWRDAARGVRAPLLYVVTPQFAAQAEALRRNRPATEVAVFERAGHALFVDEPDRFNGLLADFVARAV